MWIAMRREKKKKKKKKRITLKTPTQKFAKVVEKKSHQRLLFDCHCWCRQCVRVCLHWWTRFVFHFQYDYWFLENIIDSILNQKKKKKWMLINICFSNLATKKFRQTECNTLIHGMPYWIQDSCWISLM